MSMPRNRQYSTGVKRRRPQSYFEWLPDGALENILRFLSYKPRHSDWSQKLHSGNVLTVLETEGPLSRVARDSVSSLNSVLSVFADDSLPMHHQRFSRLVYRMGEDLRRLRVSGYSLPPLCARTIATSSLGLRELSLNIRNPSVMFLILVGVGQNLETLDVNIDFVDEDVLHLISTHCRSLRVLKAEFEVVTSSFSVIWQELGDSLEHVHMQKPSDRLITMDLLDLPGLALHCPNISVLGFKHFPLLDCFNPIEEVCTYFGSQLVAINLGDEVLTSESLYNICEACPSADINIDSRFYSSVDSIVTLGASTSVLPLHRTMTSEEYIRIGNACPNLEHIKIDNAISESACRSLFNLPKPHLRCVSLRLVNARSISAVLTVLSEKVSTLEKFVYDGSFTQVNLFRAFTNANKGLKKVRLISHCSNICHGDWRSHSEDALLPMSMLWVPLLKTCLQIPSIAEIDFLCSDRHRSPRLNEVKEACLPVRSKTISICVCRYQYQ